MVKENHLDFGYHWVWSYGHLILGTLFGTATGAAILLGAQNYVTLILALLTAWGITGFAVSRFVVRVNGLMEYPEGMNLGSGRIRILDIGCGSGRTSIMAG